MRGGRPPDCSGQGANKRHGIDDCRRACGDVQSAKIVFGQCECDPLQSYAEADWVNEVARTARLIR